MANTVKLKRSATPGAVPTTAQLALGELAMNTYDGKVYMVQNNGTASVIQVGGGAGTVTSVGATVPTGLTVSGSPITTSGTLAITYTAGYSIPTTASQTNWDTAYTDRNKWDGGATGLVAATGRTSLGGTTVGQNFFTLANPTAITFPRINADNTVSALDAATFRTAIGAGTSSTTGTVTSVIAGTGLSGGTITTTGTIALANTAVTAGSYTNTNITVDAQGRITAASSGSAGGVTTFSAGTTGLTPSTATTGAITLAGTLAIANGGTGATTASAALTALGAYPSSNPSGYTSNTGTVTSVGGTGTVNGLTLTGTVTTSGNLTLGGTLSGIANSATTATSANTASAIVARDASGNFSAGTITATLSGNASTATTASNATTAGGFTPSQTNGVASRIVVADASGYIANNYFNSTDNIATGMTYVMGKFGDNYLRSATAATVATFISGQTMNISGSATSATTATTATNATNASNSSFANGCVWENGQTISSNYTMTSGANGQSAGPITIATGVTVTIPTGSTWVIN